MWGFHGSGLGMLPELILNPGTQSQSFGDLSRVSGQRFIFQAHPT
jgi:hypothetical protein